MLEIKINDGSLEKLSIAGDTTSISADMMCAIRIVYEAIKEHDKSRADAYKIAIEKGFAFDADVDEVTEMLREKMKDSIKDLLDNMFNRRDNT